MRKKLYIIIGIIVATLVTYMAIPSRKSDEAPPPPHSAHVAARYVAAEGKVEALEGFDIEVGSDLTQRIEKFLVKEGAAVKKNDVLVRLDSRDLSARLTEVEKELSVAQSRLKEVASGSRAEEIRKASATLEAALADEELEGKNLKRSEELFGKGLIARSDLDERERAMKVASAKVKEAGESKKLLQKGAKRETVKLHEDSVEEARASVEYYRRLLDKTVIRSPIDGRVIEKYLDEGEIVIPETPIITVADVENIRINAEVDETDSGKVNIGDPVDITSDAYPGRVFKGEIEEIADYVGSRKIKPNNTAKNLDMKVLQVKVALKEKTPLKIGMTVDVRITPSNAGPVSGAKQ